MNMRKLYRILKSTLIIVMVSSAFLVVIKNVNALGWGFAGIHDVLSVGGTALHRGDAHNTYSDRWVHVWVSVGGNISQFISVNPSEFDLAPDAWQAVYFDVTVPQNASEGYYRGGINVCDNTGVCIGESADLRVYYYELFLATSDISFLNDNPPEGDVVTINATIHNSGPRNVASIIVQIYDGDPSNGGLQIGVNQTIDEISAGGKEVAEFCWDTMGLSGDHIIHVVVDPFDALFEASEQNNKASKAIMVVNSTFQITSPFIVNLTYPTVNKLRYLEPALSDGFTVKNITFTENENRTVQIKVPKEAEIIDACLNLSGYEYLDSFPNNVYLDVSQDGDRDWEYLGEFNCTNVEVSDFSGEISDYLMTCTPDIDGNCYIPLLLHSDTGGIIRISIIRVTYDYNTSCLYNVSYVSQKIGYSLNKTLHRSSVDISSSGFYIDDNATFAEIDGTMYQKDTYGSSKYVKYPENITVGSYWNNHTIWWDTLYRGVLIYVNASNVGDPLEDGSLEHPFDKIQEGVNVAIIPKGIEKDMVFVVSGIYFESVIVNRSLDLVGENMKTTIIDGNGALTVVDITVPYVKINGFTIQRGGRCGIHLPESHTTITKNIITQNRWGIDRWLDSGVIASNSVIEWNNITQNNGAIAIYISDYNRISSNNISSSGTNSFGITLYNNAKFNVISLNNFYTHGLTFVSNPGHDNIISENNFYAGGISGLGANNVIYHNNFFSTYTPPNRPSPNIWDDGYPSGGSYWSSYMGNDIYSGPYQNETGSDGVGDTPFIGNENNVDHYPLINPWTPTTTLSTNVTKGGKDYLIQVISNVTVLDFKETPGLVRLRVSGESGSSGYVRIVQPVGLNSTEIKVFLNNTKLDFPSYDPPRSISTNGTHYFIYFEFALSTHQITMTLEKVGDLGGGLSPEYFNFDNNVDGIDLALWIECYKGNAPQEAMYLADLGGGLPPEFFNCDGKVDGIDLALWIECYKGRGPDT